MSPRLPASRRLLLAATALLPLWCTGAATAAAAPYTMYEIHATSPVTLRLGATPGPGRVLVLDANSIWKPADAKKEGDGVVIQLRATDMASGRTRLLIDPPPDLDCNNRDAPTVRSITVDGKQHPPAPVVDLGTVESAPGRISVALEDAANPMAHESLVARLGGDALTPAALSPSAPQRELVCALSLPDLDFGRHELTVSAHDTSPFRNAVELRLRFTFIDTRDVAQAGLGATVKTDSCYSNYQAAPLIDGDWTSCAASGSPDCTWASAETPSDHWVEITLPQPQLVAAVAIYWAYHKPSKRVEAQTFRNGQWASLAAAERKAPEQTSTVLRFTPTETARIRVFQPAGCGREGRPDIAWMGEIAVLRAP